MLWFIIKCSLCGIEVIGTEEDKNKEMIRHYYLEKLNVCSLRNLRTEVWRCKECGDSLVPKLYPSLMKCSKCNS